MEKLGPHLSLSIQAMAPSRFIMNLYSAFLATKSHYSWSELRAMEGHGLCQKPSIVMSASASFGPRASS
jgi:hypothetical protein